MKAFAALERFLESVKTRLKNGFPVRSRNLPSKPATETSEWVQRRHQLDRKATDAVKNLLTPDQQKMFDTALLGVMGVDLGGVGVDKSNYPPGFLGPEVTPDNAVSTQ
jgi:hypothetical protein